jgi:3-oxoacyl-[acyl-carrier-protein] synthase III
MNDIFLSQIGSALGSCARTVEETAMTGQLVSPPAALRRAGFARHHVCIDGESAYTLAARAFEASGITADKLGAIVYSTCLPYSAHAGEWTGGLVRDVKQVMGFPGCRLQAEFGLTAATVIGINQQACTGMLGSLRVGRALLLAEPELPGVLCITADRFPPGALYEQAYNLISDGAVACRLGRDAGGFRLLAVHQVSNGAALLASDDETAGSFFSYSCRVVEELFARCGSDGREVDWFVAQNFNRTALDVLAHLLRLEPSRIYCPTMADSGHVISADNLRNLALLEQDERLRSGDRILTLMAGFGGHWQCALLEAV